MRNLPLVSVIMPAFNVEQYIETAIDSIINQTYESFELLISDDGSNDQTINLINKFSDPRIKLFHNDKNMGHVYTKNKLLSKACGDFITFLDADDFSSTNRLEKLVDEFFKNPRLGLCGSNIVRVFGNTLHYLPELPESDALIKKFGEAAFPAPSAVMISREAYSQIGGYRDFFKGLCYEDHDWISRIVDRFICSNINDHLYFYRFNPTSIGNTKLDTKKLASRDVVNYLKKQRSQRGFDDLQVAKSDSVTLFYEQRLNFFADPKWQYYVELRRLTEVREIARFSLWYKMFLSYPMSLVTYKSLIRIVIPVRSKVECYFRNFYFKTCYGLGLIFSYVKKS